MSNTETGPTDSPEPQSDEPAADPEPAELEPAEPEPAEPEPAEPEPAQPIDDDGPWLVRAGGYVTSGSWRGYAWTATSGQARITPENFSTAPEDSALCVAGTVPADESFLSTAILGINLNQAPDGDPLATTLSSDKSLNVKIRNLGGSALRLNLNGPNAANDETDQWCAELSNPEVLLPLTAFNTHCWDDSGDVYASEPLTALTFYVPSNAVADVDFEFCVDGVEEAATDPETPAEGAACEIVGSDCDEDCLLSCGSATCVDACCTDTTASGVTCDGVCREPSCATSDNAYWEEIASLPWICYEAEIGGKPFCGCSNYHTEAQLEDEGARVVPNCEGTYCAFFDDEGNVDCQCRGDDETTPLNCHHDPIVGCGLGEVPDCDNAPMPTCENPCEPLVYR